MEFLDRLERDLLDAADREDLDGWDDEVVEVAPVPAVESKRGRGKRGSVPRWRIVVAASAAVLSLAAAIGFVVQHTSGGANETVAAPAAGASPAASGVGATHEFANQPDQLNSALDPFAAPSAAPAPGAAGSGRNSLALPNSNSQGGVFGLNQSVANGSIKGVSSSSSGVPSTSSNNKPSNSLYQAHQIDFSKIEKDGSISVTVPKGHFFDAYNQLSTLTDNAGGMILNSQIFKETSGVFTIRVPAAKFDRVMTQLNKLVPGTTVTSSSTRSSDVTASYIDLKERLSIAIEHRAVLRKLLGKANSPGQILQYQNLLDNIQLTIEQYQGQIRFISDQVAESTIHVTIREVGASTPNTTATVIKNPDLGHAWQHGIQGLLGVIGAVVIGLGYLVPIAILLAILWFLVGVVRRRRSEPAPAGGGGE